MRHEIRKSGSNSRRRLKAGGSQDWLPHKFCGIPDGGKTK